MSEEKERMTVYLRKELIKKIDSMAKAIGLSRSEFVEFLLEQGSELQPDISTLIEKASEIQRELKRHMRRRAKR